MQIGDIVTTPVEGYDDTVKVEVIAQANTTDTLPNYGTVALEEGEYHWAIASGQSGVDKSSARAVTAAAQAIRDHWKRTREASKRESQKVIAVVPASVVEAVNNIVHHYGSANVKGFYSVDGEAILTYRDEDRGGTGKIHIVPDRRRDTWVCLMHTTPGHVEAGLPDVFVSSPMYDTSKDWWPSNDD
jgi:hypothetical protein